MEPTQVHDRTGELQIVDVREPDEWQAGHIRAARHIPMDELPGRLDEIDRDQPVVTVCRSGSRSGKMADFLREHGYDAQNMEGGMRAWDDADLPLVSADGAPSRVARPDEDRGLHDLLLTLTRDLEAHTGGRPPTEDDAREFLRERLQAQGKSEEEIAYILDAQ